MVVVSPEKPNLKDVFKVVKQLSLLIFMLTYMPTCAYRASCAQGQWAQSLEAEKKGIFSFA